MQREPVPNCSIERQIIRTHNKCSTIFLCFPFRFSFIPSHSIVCVDLSVGLSNMTIHKNATLYIVDLKCYLSISSIQFWFVFFVATAVVVVKNGINFQTKISTFCQTVNTKFTKGYKMELSKCLHCLYCAPNIVPFPFFRLQFFSPVMDMIFL